MYRVRMITNAYLTDSAAMTSHYVIALWVAALALVVVVTWQCLVVYRLGLLTCVGVLLSSVVAVWLIGAAPVAVMVLGLVAFSLRALRIV